MTTDPSLSDIFVIEMRPHRHGIKGKKTEVEYLEDGKVRREEK
jgi:hypothetical protein